MLYKLIPIDYNLQLVNDKHHIDKAMYLCNLFLVYEVMVAHLKSGDQMILTSVRITAKFEESDKGRPE